MRTICTPHRRSDSKNEKMYLSESLEAKSCFHTQNSTENDPFGYSPHIEYAQINQARFVEYAATERIPAKRLQRRGAQAPYRT